MKRFYIAILAVATALASCNKMEEIDNPADNQPEIDAELTADQILCAIPQTKTALDENLNVIWSENDEVMVLGADNQTGIYKFNSYVADDNKTAAVFENVDTKVTGSRSAIYPATAYVADSYNGTTAQIELGGVDAVTIPTGSPSEVLGKTVVSTLPLVSTPSEETLSFSNLFGGVMFRPYDYMGMGVKIQKLSIASTDGKALAGVATVDLATGKMTKFEGTDTELTFNYGDTDITSKKGFIAYIPAGEYAGLVITPIDHLGRKFPVTTGAITVNAGKVKQLPELPLTIWYGSANCYNVAPGQTSIDIDITPRYSWRSDYDITSGNVIMTTGGNMSELGNGAKVIWQQEESSTLTDLTATGTTDGPIINGKPTINLELSIGHKGTMTVPLSGKKGNAVVALTSKINSANYVWSFHIWVSEVNDIACSTTMGSYSILDRNIGATSCLGKDQDQTGYPNSFGLYYQWGRKDPFPKCLSTDLGEASNTYHYKSNLLKAARRSDVSPNIAYTITNPDTRIVQSGKDRLNWLENVNNALWGYGTACGSSSDAFKVQLNQTVKTVYDPCPKGYRVPPAGYMHQIGKVSGNATSSTVNSNFGIYLSTGSSTTFVPMTGIMRSRGYKGTGSESEYSLSYPTYRGYVWSSTPRNNDQGNYLFWFNNAAINNSTTNYLNGFCETTAQAIPVRCIKE